MVGLTMAPLGAATASASPSPTGRSSSPSCITAPSASPQLSGEITAAGDNAHISSDPSGQASAHGWWNYISGDFPPDGVTVTVTLYAYLTAPECGGFYSVGTIGEKVSTTPGSGSGKWATARADCVSTRSTKWYSVVTAIVNDEPNYGNPSITTPTVSLNCDPQ